MSRKGTKIFVYMKLHKNRSETKSTLGIKNPQLNRVGDFYKLNKNYFFLQTFFAAGFLQADLQNFT